MGVVVVVKVYYEIVSLGVLLYWVSVIFLIIM